MKRPLLRWPVITALQPGTPPPPLWARLAWMAGIWAASIIALTLVALLLRLVLKA